MVSGCLSAENDGLLRIGGSCTCKSRLTAQIFRLLNFPTVDLASDGGVATLMQATKRQVKANYFELDSREIES